MVELEESLKSGVEVDENVKVCGQGRRTFEGLESKSMKMRRSVVKVEGRLKV